MYPQENGKKVKLYTGSYNAPVVTGDGSVYLGNGQGICLWEFDESTGEVRLEESWPEALNASWLTISPDGKMLYAVNELDDYEGTMGGALSAYRIDMQGYLAADSILPVMGAAPCHVSCDGSGRHVFTANYNGGSMSCFRLSPDGGLAEMDGQLVHSFGEKENADGRERLRHPVRQEKPHVHSAAVKDGFVWVADLGTDEISCYELDEEGKPGKCAASVFLEAGSGPRSFAFSQAGNMVYVTCELKNRIAVYRWEKEERRLSFVQMVSSLPEEEAGVGSSIGGIVISDDGRYIYVGNRGADTIGVFAVDNDGLLSPVQWISSEGKNPRGFTLAPSGGWLLAANQDSDNLVVFEREPDTGLLRKKKVYEAGAVVCLLFAE